ncbi:sulfite oxidase [Saccharopolyspora griseoalba]|uniref:Sulfite oxidase n=1 Tax=Saccharopolyspora griseoalba TaxID=1431848 RepID=A0ABW2LP28_9PSEU
MAERTATMWGKSHDVTVHQSDPFNAESSLAVLVQEPVTSAEDFYVRNHGPVPELDPRLWRLSVEGMVERSLELSLEDLQNRFEHHDVAATLQCAGNRRSGLAKVHDIPGHPWGPGATSTATWTGARLADVLAAAGAESGAHHVAFEAPDIAPEAMPPERFGASIPIAKALGNEVLLAWGMNGHPLPAVHGAPVRVVVPGYIGARSVKWVERISVQERPSQNFFQSTAYRLLPPGIDPYNAPPGDGLALGPLAVNSAILTPDDGAVLPAGPTAVTGYALSGDDRGIARVDISLDGGRSWQQADLDEPLSPWSWTPWRITLDLPPGDVEIIARAWDTSAAVQPEHEAPLWNPKGYFNNAWSRINLTTTDRPG